MVRVQQYQDIHVARFGDDEDVALFVAGTSDVLRCSVVVWESLLGVSGFSPVAVESVDRGVDEDTGLESPVNILRSTLHKLGAKFH